MRTTTAAALLLAAGLPLPVLASGDGTPVLRAADLPARRLEPARIRGVRLLEDGTIQPTTEWLDYAPPAPGPEGRIGVAWVFDAYQSDTGAPGGNPTGGIDCGLGGEGSRWYFGGGLYTNNCFANDLRVAFGAEGLAATTLDYAFHDNTCDNPAVHCIFTAEDFDATCAGPAYANPYEGIMLEYPTPCDPFFYQAVSVDVTGRPDLGPIQMPLDGEGAYIVVCMERTPEGELVLDQGVQPMLWSTGGPSDPWGRVGTSGPIQWEFSNGSTGVPDGCDTMPDLCFDYGGMVACPLEPVGAMLGFGIAGFTPCYADCDRDSMLTSGDYTCFRESYLASDLRADCNGDGVLNVADFSCFHGAFVSRCQ